MAGERDPVRAGGRAAGGAGTVRLNVGEPQNLFGPPRDNAAGTS